MCPKVTIQESLKKKNPPSKKGHLDTALKISQQEKSSHKDKCLQKRKNRNKMLFSYRCLSDYNFVLQLFSHPNAKPAQYSKLFIQLNLLFSSFQLLPPKVSGHHCMSATKVFSSTSKLK